MRKQFGQAAVLPTNELTSLVNFRWPVGFGVVVLGYQLVHGLLVQSVSWRDLASPERYQSRQAMLSRRDCFVFVAEMIVLGNVTRAK